MPDISLIDPSLLTTKSPELIAATGMDTLTHAIEAYVSSLSWTLTDPHAIHAIDLVMKHLVRAFETKDKASLEGISIACLEAGIAFSNAFLGAVHALAHPLGGFYDIHHGLANAVLLPIIIRKNMPHCAERYAQIATAMGIDTIGMSAEEAAWSVFEKTRQLMEALELPCKLSDFGMNAEDVPMLSELARQDICMLTNPCCYSKEEIQSIYLEAM